MGYICFCHGDRHEEGWEVNETNASGSGCEYVYAFTKKDGHNIMLVLSSYCDDGRKMVGFFGFGDPNANWQQIGEVDLDSNTGPNWSEMK